jgi:hypothetical protein
MRSVARKVTSVLTSVKMFIMLVVVRHPVRRMIGAFFFVIVSALVVFVAFVAFVVFIALVVLILILVIVVFSPLEPVINLGSTD